MPGRGSTDALPSRSQKIVAVYRGWHAYEQANGGPEIIDFDLAAPSAGRKFASRSEILRALRELKGLLRGDVAEEAEFLRARVIGSIAYLRALMGQQMTFDAYMKATLGLVPRPFSDSYLDRLRTEVDRSLAPYHLKLRPEDRSGFERTLLIEDRARIRSGIVDGQAYWLARLRAQGIPAPKKLRLRVEFTETDNYWSNWIKGSRRKGITLAINLHPRKRYDLGRPLALCLHEICGHATQMSIWAAAIQAGRMDPACGITTVHSPEAFVAEGLAQLVADFLQNHGELPAEVTLSRRLEHYSLCVLHNAHLMIYDGRPVEEILDYACEKLPFHQWTTLEAEVRDRGRNPLLKSYQLSYALSARVIGEMARGMSRKQHDDFFRAMYTRPLTPRSLRKLRVRPRQQRLAAWGEQEK